jgi:hypothetical protein
VRSQWPRSGVIVHWRAAEDFAGASFRNRRFTTAIGNRATSGLSTGRNAGARATLAVSSRKDYNRNPSRHAIQPRSKSWPLRNRLSLMLRRDGEVWKARDTRLNRIVALKFARAAFTDCAQREAQAIAALNYPNIATLYDVGPEYLVMEYVKGAPHGGHPQAPRSRRADRRWTRRRPPR